jgi:hypothetical protein
MSVPTRETFSKSTPLGFALTSGDAFVEVEQGKWPIPRCLLQLSISPVQPSLDIPKPLVMPAAFACSSCHSVCWVMSLWVQTSSRSLVWRRYWRTLLIRQNQATSP